MRIEKDYKKISHTCRARKENKLGKSVRNDIVKTVLSTEWNLKTSKATSFLWKILLSIIRTDLGGTLAFGHLLRHALLLFEK